MCFSLQQSSQQRHREHLPLPLPGCYLLHDWTLAGCGPPSLPGLLLGSCAAQRCLLVCPASTDPLSGLHRRTDTVFLHGCADLDGSGSVCLNIHEYGEGMNWRWYYLRFVACVRKSRGRIPKRASREGKTRLSVQ